MNTKLMRSCNFLNIRWSVHSRIKKMVIYFETTHPNTLHRTHRSVKDLKLFLANDSKFIAQWKGSEWIFNSTGSANCELICKCAHRLGKIVICTHYFTDFQPPTEITDRDSAVLPSLHLLHPKNNVSDYYGWDESDEGVKGCFLCN